MRGFINSEQTISVMEARDPGNKPIPFTVTFVSKSGAVKEWQNVILAKNKKRSPVRARKNSKILKFYLEDTGEIRSLHFWQIIKINHLNREP